MEVIPWQKMCVVMLTIVYTIIIVSVMPKKLQYVIVDVMKQKKLKKLLVKLLNVDRNFGSYLFYCFIKSAIMVTVKNMKRIVFIIICSILLTGCFNNSLDDDKNDKLYKQYKIYEEMLNESKNYQDGSDEFSIRLIINKIDDETNRYDVVIDSPKINMYHLQAIAKVEQDESASLPNLGILEDDVFSLVPNVIDKEKGIYKGVNLSGITTKKEFNVLVYLTFYNDENGKEKEERFIRLYGNAIR